MSDYIKKGERWFVKYPGATALTHVAIKDVTASTVLIKSVEDRFNLESRYAIADLEFIEKTGPFPPIGIPEE
ncbi:MAG: hypothetical protein N0C84_17110 [Candidatus Thiodiazotropha taylori]|uniref:Uncharacterized protein n=1 Tax=Candidatus Thiodiazotropha taylori TaxID=2792791 RepID=A0A9E4T3B2_9GAMM|nr:hypothetical protein [Candidatus Thiodiazotropha taylori]MCW4258187.1 hypothetical protein [Candidatus Thiodiazotropha taylori]